MRKIYFIFLIKLDVYSNRSYGLFFCYAILLSSIFCAIMSVAIYLLFVNKNPLSYRLFQTLGL